MKTSDEKSYLSKNYYTSINLYKNDRLALYTEFTNDTDGDIQYVNAKVTRVSQTEYQVKNGADIITFPGNLTVGMSITENDLINKFGNPNDKKDYSSDNYNSVKYKYFANSNWTTTNYFEIDLVNGKIDEITLDNR